MKLFLTSALILLTAVGSYAQSALGKHPADTVLPQFFLQNNNAEKTVAGINGAATKVTNVDWSLSPGGTNAVSGWISISGAIYPSGVTASSGGWIATSRTIYPQ